MSLFTTAILGTNQARASLAIQRWLLTVVLLGATVMSCWSEETGSAGYWKLDAASKTSVKDLSGQGHDGQVLGSPGWLQSAEGKLLRLDGKDACVVTEPVAFDAKANGATLEAWIYPMGSGAGSILSIGGGNWPPYSYLRLMRQKHQRLQCESILSSTMHCEIKGTSPDNTLPLKQWSHVAAVLRYDSSSSNTYLVGYINGIEVINESVPGVCLPTIPSHAARPIVIGATTWSAYPNHAPSDYFEGVIDEVKIYTRALTSEEIQHHFSMRKPSELKEPAQDALPAAAKLIYQDDFERESLGSDWKIKSGEWRIRDGALYGIGPGAEMTYTGTNFAGSSLRLEYTAWSERPCDLSAWLKNSKNDKDNFLFQFGAQNNILSGINHGKENLWQTRDVTIRPAFRHRIICERWGNLVRFFVDGKRVFSGLDTTAVSALDTIGFYIWSEGFIDDIKLYALSGSPDDLLLPAESHLEIGEWFGFNEATTNPLPAEITGTCRGKSTVKRSNFPDYEHWKNTERTVPTCVDDGCLELTCPPGAEERAEITCSFNALTSGFVEVELLAMPMPDAKPGYFELSLSDGDAENPVAQLTTDTNGNFIAASQNQTHVLLRNRYQLPNVSLPMRFWFTPNRWYRFRVMFDAAKSTYTVVVVELYTGHPCNGTFPTAHADWRVLASDIPFRRSAKDGKITQAIISTRDGHTLNVDNLYVVGPYQGEQTINGVDYRRPARVILGKPERPRHDPIDLKVFSLRNTPDPDRMAYAAYSTDQNKRQDFIGSLLTNQYPEIVAAARLYDHLLIDQAFLGTEGKKIERLLFYLNATEPAVDNRRRAGEALVRAIDQTEEELAGLYQSYAAAYLDGLNATRIQQDFMPKATAFQATLEDLKGKSQTWLEELQTAEEKEIEGAKLAALDPEERIPYRGRFTHRADNAPSFYFSRHCALLWPEQEELLRLDNCHTITPLWSDKPYNRDEYIDRDWFLNRYFTDTRPFIASMRGVRPNASFFVSYGMGSANCNFAAPIWWAEENKDDKDILFCDENGQGSEVNPKSSFHKLNYWNPKVKALFRAQTLDIADFFSLGKPGRAMAFYICQEAWHTVGSFATGYNASAKEAFRTKMREQYGQISKLNKQWETAYASFEVIEPPPSIAKSPRTRPTALCYEWELFRQEGYRDWIQIVRTALKEKLPDVPLCSNFSAGAGLFPGYADPIAGFDLTQIYPLFDYFQFHVSKTELSRVPNRVLTSLRRVFGGEAASIEWGPGSSRDNFDEVDRRRSTEADFFRLAADGRSFFNVWYGLNVGWADQSPMTDPRLSYSVLSYGTASVPLSITKLRNLERYFLDYPHVEPKIKILESNSSFLNACPLNGVREGMRTISDQLETAGLDYGFVWENLIQEGKQSLESSEVIIMPNAITMPEDVQEKLKRWVSQGGTLIAVGAPGVYDPWGRPAGMLLKAAFGDLAWTLTDRGTWVPEGNPVPVKLGSYADGGTIYRATLGKGTFILFDNESKARTYANPELSAKGAAPEDSLVKLVREYARPVFYGTNNQFELTLREDKVKKCWYMTALNNSPYQSAEDELRFRGPPVNVRDLEIPGVTIATRHEGEETAFRICLAPGEGVMLELKPVK